MNFQSLKSSHNHINIIEEIFLNITTLSFSMYKQQNHKEIVN